MTLKVNRKIQSKTEFVNVKKTSRTLIYLDTYLLFYLSIWQSAQKKTVEINYCKFFIPAEQTHDFDIVTKNKNFQFGLENFRTKKEDS